ncbi:MAG: GNAT family N-acetyltransferase [Thermoplasmata archaeon]|jgi:ribosomal protein S18 acetylase RimI-like enzyme|nr:GNAT family N-acetyltransferase [Thermoplasmata archaeon]
MDFRIECERCHAGLTEVGPAYFCAHECTYCATCARHVGFVCPNCSGELVRRPRRGPSTPAAPPAVSVSDATMAVRRATVDDLDSVAPLFNAYRIFYAQESDLGAARLFLQGRLSQGQSEVWVAEDPDRALGFVQMYPTFSSVSLGPVLVLNDLFVLPDARLRGVGARLLEAARARGLAVGAHYLELSTAVDNPAQRLYEACGWKLDREFLHYELLFATPPGRA